MSELLPCPFCKKGKAYTIKPARYGKSWGVLCECGAFLGYEYTEAEAIAAWNTRAERTCKMETDHDELEVIAYSHEDTWAYKCSACDWSFRYDRGIKPDFCPNCGARVVGE